MKGTSFGFGGVAVFVAAAWTLAAAADIPRTANGKPDFSGYYDTATTTPLERRSGEATLSADAADAIAKRTAAGLAAGSRDLAPDRGAPPLAATVPAARPATWGATIRSGWIRASGTPWWTASIGRPS